MGAQVAGSPMDACGRCHAVKGDHGALRDRALLLRQRGQSLLAECDHEVNAGGLQGGDQAGEYGNCHEQGGSGDAQRVAGLTP